MTEVNGDMKQGLIFDKMLFFHHHGSVFRILVFMEIMFIFLDLYVLSLFLKFTFGMFLPLKI